MEEASAILVVDDTEANRYAIGRHLRGAGYEVWEAGTGKQALQLAERGPALITLDVQLPDMLGYEVCRRLKDNPQTASIPVLEISAAFRSSTDRVRGLESGADGYLNVPVDADELLANVRLLLRLRESQENLRRSQAKFRQQAQLLDLAHDAIIVLDLDHRIQFWNRGAEEVYGWTAAEAVGQVSHELLHTEFPLPIEELKAIVKIKGTWHGELIHRHRDNRRIVVDSRWAVRPDEDGEPAAILEINRDVTERKRAEEAAQVNQSRLQAILDNAKAVIYMVDRDGRILLVNRHFYHLFQLNSDETVGKTLWDIFPAENANSFHVNNQRVLEAGKPMEFEESAPQEGGTHVYLSIKVPLLDGSGKPYAVCGISTDITERKRTENELWQKTAELQESQARLQEYAEELESKVQHRTTALARANEELQQQVAKRNRAEQHREALLRTLVNAQEEERLRISRELHDRTGQHLTALLLGLTTLDKCLEDVGKSRDRLTGLQKLTNEMGQELHRIASELRPTALNDVGLRSTLKNYVQEWATRCNIEADFQGSGYTGQGISPEVEITLYRVTQEALTNVAKHAAATRVSVILERTSSLVQVIVEDDGRGFDADAALDSPATAGRLGLVGMRERLGFVGGSLSIESSPGSGTTVFARVPVGTQV
jgi:PAS domain S-box-containing protein